MTEHDENLEPELENDTLEEGSVEEGQLDGSEEEYVDESEHVEGDDTLEHDEEGSDYEPDFTFRQGDDIYEMDDRVKPFIKNKEDEED